MNATVTPTYTLGRFVWRELLTRDVAAAKKFYGELFGWATEDRPMGEMVYSVWTSNGKQIGGLMDLKDMPGDGAGIPANWAVSVSVADVDATAALAVAEGGTVVGGCHDIPDVGRFANVQDPTGAYLTLMRFNAGDQPDTKPGVHDFCWENLVSTDLAKAIPFYTKVIGWGTEVMGDGATTLFTRQSGGEAVQLASTGAADGTPSYWCPFVRVASLPAAVAKARELGAKIHVEGVEIPHVGVFAVIEDLAEASIFLFEDKAG